MMTPGSFHEQVRHVVNRARQRRLELPGDEMAMELLALFNPSQEMLLVVPDGANLRMMKPMVRAAIERHGSVAAIYTGECYTVEHRPGEPRPKGDYGLIPGAREALMCSGVWPQAGVATVDMFEIIRTVFGVVDLVPRVRSKPGDVVETWVSDLLPQPALS